MPHKLTSDELSKAGETAFKNLSGRAELVCNKSDRDVTRWDFVVEFPMAAGAAATLDQRQAAACVVQHKLAAGESASRVAARLSAIERIAKDPRPAILVTEERLHEAQEHLHQILFATEARLSRSEAPPPDTLVLSVTDFPAGTF